MVWYAFFTVMVSTGFLGGIICGSAAWLLRLCTAERKTQFKANTKDAWIFAGLSFGNAAVIVIICRMEGMLWQISGEYGHGGLYIEGILLSLLAGGFLSAALMDAESCYVYNYVWWWSLLWTVILLWLPQTADVAGNLSAGELLTCKEYGMILPHLTISQLAAVAGFCILQQCLFAKMYGRADSYAFSVCALASCYFCGNMIWFLIHMLLAVSLLAIVQLWNKNVARNGRLCTPKPFIPYIIITFWLEILCMLCLEWKAHYR